MMKRNRRLPGLVSFNGMAPLRSISREARVYGRTLKPSTTRSCIGERTGSIAGTLQEHLRVGTWPMLIDIMTLDPHRHMLHLFDSLAGGNSKERTEDQGAHDGFVSANRHPG